MEQKGEADQCRQLHRGGGAALPKEVEAQEEGAGAGRGGKARLRRRAGVPRKRMQIIATPGEKQELKKE